MGAEDGLRTEANVTHGKGAANNALTSLDAKN
jgi:hypothetical protein